MSETNTRRRSKTGGTDKDVFPASVEISDEVMTEIFRSYWLTWNILKYRKIIDIDRTIDAFGRPVSFTVFYKEEE